MQVSRRRFLGATSGAATLTTLTTLSSRTLAQGPAQTAEDPLGVRRDFPGADECTFLNTAYIGLISRPVLEAGRAWLDARAHAPHEVGAKSGCCSRPAKARTSSPTPSISSEARTW
jgi:hypothetical protein